MPNLVHFSVLVNVIVIWIDTSEFVTYLNVISNIYSIYWWDHPLISHWYYHELINKALSCWTYHTYLGQVTHVYIYIYCLLNAKPLITLMNDDLLSIDCTHRNTLELNLQSYFYIRMHLKVQKIQPFYSRYNKLTHCGLVISYGTGGISQHWFR